MNFYTRISDYYNHIFPLNKNQLPFVQSCSTNAKKVLDIGCGTGGLAVELSDVFDSVIGIDINNEMIEIAIANNKNTNLEFAIGGMLDIDRQFGNSMFDTVLCFGNTIVHLSNIDEIQLFFQKVKQVLAPDGKFLFQIISYDNVLDNNLNGLPTIENDIIKFERHYKLDNDNLIDFSTILTIKKTGEVIRNTVKLFPVRKEQVEKALRNVGFKEIQVFSSFTKIKYDQSSLPLIFECSK